MFSEPFPYWWKYDQMLGTTKTMNKYLMNWGEEEVDQTEDMVSVLNKLKIHR